MSRATETARHVLQKFLMLGCVAERAVAKLVVDKMFTHELVENRFRLVERAIDSGMTVRHDKPDAGQAVPVGENFAIGERLRTFFANVEELFFNFRQELIFHFDA